MQGGINNAGLFGASQREARSKLDQMAGIKRPSGILASSPELMRAAAGPAMMQPPPQQPMPMPTNMPMVQPALQAMPMPTTVSPMAPAPAPRPLNPMAPAPAGQQPVVKLNQGGEPLKGYSDMGARLAEKAKASVAAGGSPVVDITIEPLKFIQDMDKKTGGAVTEQFGSVEAAAKEGTRKANIIESATAATKDPSKIADAVLVASGEQPTEAAKMDFAENVFGLENVNDIDEINRRIANVAIGGSVAKSPEEFTQAVLLGLQAYKQTATARAAGAAGGTTGFTKDRTALRAYQDTLDSLTRSLSDRDLPEGYTGSVADYAAEQALKQVLKTYPIEQIPPQLLGQGGGQPRRPEPPAGGLETFLIEAQKINPGSSVEELTEFYTKKYGG
jgi:hypothetical protein